MSSLGAGDRAHAFPRRLRLGMVGGGRGAFIGEAHRIAARLDDCYDLVAGALSSDPETARASGADLGLAEDRAYTDFRHMAEAEAARDDGIDVVSVVTPNHVHHPVCRAFLEAGIDVICDKPLAVSLDEARDLAASASAHARLLGVTYSYSGYPMVREARALVAAGRLGRIRVVQTEFVLGWLADDTTNKQAEWRMDPQRSGSSFIVADLGTHCFHLIEYVTGSPVQRLAADVRTVVQGRQLDDDAHIWLDLGGEAKADMWVSAVAAGETVGLRLRVYGEKGHIAWDQSHPDDMTLALRDEGRRIVSRGEGGLSAEAARATRMVAGLPEGYYEAHANLYRDYAELIAARLWQHTPDPLARSVPCAEAGVRGLAFVEAALASQRAGNTWQTLSDAKNGT